jgi:hypothetical protein
MRPSRFEFFLLGIASVFFGIMILIQPRLYDHLYRRYFDLSSYNIPLGAGFIAIGIVFIWTMLRKKEKSKE